MMTIDCGSHCISRNYNHLLKLKRDISKSLSSQGSLLTNGFPSTCFKNLTCDGSWTKHGTGWKLCYSTSVNKLDNWLNSLLIKNTTIALEFCDDTQHNQLCDLRNERLQREARPRQLQQYFASDANIDILLDLLGYGSAIVAPGTLDSSEIVYVDPSCGDGRILKTLLLKGATNVFGCDIDPVVADIASKTLAETVSIMNNNSHATILVEDFLSTTRESLSTAYSHTNTTSHSCHSSGSSSSSSSSGSGLFATRVFVAGSPPFSNCRLQKIRNSQLSQCVSTNTIGEDHLEGIDDECADYPMLFLKHCAHQLQAEKIALLLPVRCAKTSFIESAFRILNNPSSYEELVCQQKWTLAKMVAGDGSFELAGTVVRLPCIIHLWEREVS
eukprot:scaffold1931_cov215-Ochromonas_danica.AAC.25